MLKTKRFSRPIEIPAEVFLRAMRDELFRRHYHEERTHPEWIDLGGES